ncbi:MAG: nitrile hydratase subunit beta [Candidatus Rokubacteria bacterium]|nr:nitrile hydratase subunit beta [Candidatus Rokubacteria bacterium]
MSPEVPEAGGARYRPGEVVRVRADVPRGHARTPAYIRGKTGWVERLHGIFRNPESLAYGSDGLPKQPLYLVGFRQTDLWERYGGPARDTVYVDVYEHWLDPA